MEKHYQMDDGLSEIALFSLFFFPLMTLLLVNLLFFCKNNAVSVAFFIPLYLFDDSSTHG